jgi:hypothetical protein
VSVRALSHALLARGHTEEVTTFLVPIEGLTLTEPWDLGPIRLHTAASLDAALASTAMRLLDHQAIGEPSREVAEEMRQGTAAQVDTPDIDAARRS